MSLSAQPLPHPRPRLPRIAIVVPALAARGGLASVALFLYRTIQESGRFDPALISLATSSTDPNSVRLTSPRSWLHGVRSTRETLGDIPYTCIGSAIAEVEPFRYRPRQSLTALLQNFDLIQLVAGTPALAHVTRDITRPVVLQCATTIKVERRALLRSLGPVSLWRRLMTALVARMDATGLRLADVILVENERMRQYASRQVGARRVRFSPPGVDIERFRPPPEHQESDVLLTVGRLDDPRKNLRMLVEAYALIRTHHPKLRLVLAGERPPTPDVIALARKRGVAEGIEVRLALSDEDLASLYRQAAVFALTSEEEGLGIAALEAMASGVPAVCTRCGGPETYVTEGKTGYLVDIDAVSAFADRVTRLLSRPELRRQMGAEARRYIVDHFSGQQTGARFLAVYDELLTAPHGTSIPAGGPAAAIP